MTLVENSVASEAGLDLGEECLLAVLDGERDRGDREGNQQLVLLLRPHGGAGEEAEVGGASLTVSAHPSAA